MKKLLLGFFLCILAGCSTNEVYTTAMQKGLDHIEREAYEKAEDAFSIALTEKPNDASAEAHLAQTKGYQAAHAAFDKGDIKTAKQFAGAVVQIEHGSPTLVALAEALLARSTHTEETETTISEALTRAKTYLNAKQYHEAKEILTTIQQTAANTRFAQEVTALYVEADTVLANIAREKQADAEAAELAQQRQLAEQATLEQQTSTFTADYAAEYALRNYTGVPISDDIDVFSLDAGASYDSTGPSYDEKGAYYMIILFSKTLSRDGGSGTFMRVHVYEDGTLEVQ